jgi:hypothetical protein
MLLRPFLTQLDSRAAIKGSRDPLGVQSIWTRLGRHVVGNLSTVSNSVRDFTVLLVGCYLVEAVAEAGGTEGDVATFLKWEQLAAYSRAEVNEDFRFRGKERTALRLREEGRLRLAADSGAQILGNQKIYGLWGLYTVPARSSGLLEGDPLRLTPAARDVVERSLVPFLAPDGARTTKSLVDRLRAKESFLDRGRGADQGLMKAVAELLKVVRPLERSLYRDHLLHGGPADANPNRGTQGRQRLFAELLSETFHEQDWSLTPEVIATLAHRAKARGTEVGEQLAHRLERIRTAELLLAPAVDMFDYVLSCDDQSRTQIAEDIAHHWGRVFRETIDLANIEALEPELRSPDADSGARWVALARALHDANYEEAIDLVLAQNAAVMQARSAAAPWAQMRDGKLHVRFRDQQSVHLPGAEAIPRLWHHAYFIESLRSIAYALRETNG